MTAKLSAGALARRKRREIGDRKERTYRPDGPVWAVLAQF